MLDAVATDSEFAVESVRAKKRSFARDHSESANEGEYTQKYRDPGYSQAVRRTCQQRMVQLIPVRRGTLTIVLTCMWILWGCLLFSHYWIFTRPALTAAPNMPNATSFSILPIAQLFHLRSPHSIAQWLTCQLWMLTAVAACMIFQLRRHKLDDYRARYRIWVLLAIAAAFSSFEASSSGLMLLGMSIDGWARKEIGYGGWPLVLASFASIIGVIGIRLCSELKSAPMSVVSWLFGLLAWAASALLGTGLLKTTLSSATIDLVVGGCLLGGILAVFQASGIYLRQTYIHAQKRFLVRNGANLAPIQLRIPKFSLRRKRDESGKSEESIASAGKPKWKLPWPRRRNKAMDEFKENGNPQSTNRVSGSKSVDKTIDKSRRSLDDEGVQSKTKAKGRLLGIVPNRHELNERLEAEPIAEDDGSPVDQGLTKKRGWFGIGGNRDAESKPPASASKSVTQTTRTESRKIEADTAKPKRGWVSRFSKSQKPNDSSVTDSRSPKQTFLPIKQPSVKQVQDVEKVDGKEKKSWLSFASKKPKDPTEPRVVANKSERAKVDEPAAKTGRRGLFGMLDGLKLKPPPEEKTRQNSPGSMKPMPIKQGQQIPSTQGDSDDDEGDDDYSGRPMSKADRKKLRRQQLDDRRAA